jgi:hypothetical protein
MGPSFQSRAYPVLIESEPTFQIGADCDGVHRKYSSTQRIFSQIYGSKTQRSQDRLTSDLGKS